MIRPEVGAPIPPWTMEFVDPARMKTMAAILRDPYPVHWDRDSNERIGLGPHVINQGPLNLSYITNMLIAWAGPASVRRLTVSFVDRVLDGDRVTAHGTIESVATAAEGHVDGDEWIVGCRVWLERDGQHVVTGTAVVAIPVDRVGGSLA